ncbi:MAG: hypothetical protein ABIT01_10835 [Thermoanaerobaculia bacterium]
MSLFRSSPTSQVTCSTCGSAITLTEKPRVTCICSFCGSENQVPAELRTTS